MHKRTLILLIAVCTLTLSSLIVAFVAQGAQGVQGRNPNLVPTGGPMRVVPTPTAIGGGTAACTATPAMHTPYPTLPMSMWQAPGADATLVAQFQATHPGDVANAANVYDLASSVPFEQKDRIFVRHANCTYDYYLVPPSQLTSFPSTLKRGDTIIQNSGPSGNDGKHIQGTLPVSGTPGTGKLVAGTAMRGTMQLPLASVAPPSSAFKTAVAHTPDPNRLDPYGGH